MEGEGIPYSRISNGKSEELEKLFQSLKREGYVMRSTENKGQKAHWGRIVEDL